MVCLFFIEYLIHSKGDGTNANVYTIHNRAKEPG